MTTLSRANIAALLDEAANANDGSATLPDMHPDLVPGYKRKAQEYRSAAASMRETCKWRKTKDAMGSAYVVGCGSPMSCGLGTDTDRPCWCGRTVEVVG